MKKVLLDDTFARTVQRPEKSYVDYDDTLIPQYQARVYRDRIVATLRYRAAGSTSNKRATVGTHPAMTMAQLRKQAETMRGRVRTGSDPSAERKALKEERRKKETEVQLTVGSALDLYEPVVQARKSSGDQDIGHLTRNFRAQFGSRSLVSISKADCAKRIAEVFAVTPTSSIRLRAALLAFWTWTIEAGLIDKNPMDGIGKPKMPKNKTKAKRYLTPAELVVMLKAIEASDMAIGLKRAFKVLAYTGQRAAEISGLALSELNYIDHDGEAYALIAAERMKARRDHIVPLVPQVVAIINAEMERQADMAQFEDRRNDGYVFASKFSERSSIARHSLSQAMLRLINNLADDGPDAEIIKGIKANRPTPHAFRRTFSTLAASIGIIGEHRKAVLAHTDESVEGQHYNHYEYANEKRAALTKWAKHIDSLLTGATATGTTVIPMRSRT